MIIGTERLILRPFEEKDAADMFEYLKKPAVNCFACMKLDSLKEAKEEARRRADDTDLYFAIVLKESGKVIGEIDAAPETTAPDGYYPLTGNVLITSSANGIYAGRSDDTVVSYTVDEPTDDNPNYVVHITNSAGTALPMTGGTGTSRFYILGSMLIAGSLMYEYSLRRNRKRKEVK